MSGTYSISFTNVSNVTFNLSVYGFDNMFGHASSSPLLGLTQSPGATLMAEAGLETIAVEDNTLPVIATGGYHDLFCVWRNPANGQRFGVLIHAPLQVFTIGTAPYYRVMSDTTPDSEPDAAPVWQDTGADPSAQYNWTGLAGVAITAVPVAEHQDMNIQVLVNPA